MNFKKIIIPGAIQALAAAAYITAVAFFIYNGNKLFGPQDGPFAIAIFLLALVISVTVMGTLIFLRPAMWYLNGAKIEAIKLLLTTIIFLCLIAVIFLFFLIL